MHVFGSGKASVGMAKSLLSLLGEHVAGGVIVSTQLGDDDLFPLVVVQGSHPVPDEKSIHGAGLLIDALADLKSDDFFIYLLSGGSSALIEKPVQTHQPCRDAGDNKAAASQQCPHPADQCNPQTSQHGKGGRLGQCSRASGVVLVISDVIGDDLSVIGSGPLYYDPSDLSAMPGYT